MDLAVQDWLCLRKEGKATLGYIHVVWPRSGNQLWARGRHSGVPREFRVGGGWVQLPLKVMTPPARCIVCSVSFLSQPVSDIVHARNWSLVDSEEETLP